MSTAAANKKRPYMPATDRRAALLDIAAEIVGRNGWSALTMKGLAMAAGVSRQLVYEHFEDGPQLFLAAMRHLFERSYRATAEVLQNPKGDLPATIRAAYQIFLEMPAAQRRALRALSGDIGTNRPETRKARTLMRHEILALWVPYAKRQTGLAESRLRPIVWMLTTAAWGLADLVDDGLVSTAQAKDVLAYVVARVMVGDKNLDRVKIR
jgi:AcrR family transcriptional regulator